MAEHPYESGIFPTLLLSQSMNRDIRKVVFCSMNGMLYPANTPNYNRLNEWPLQFLRTGHYGRSYGYLFGRTADSYWWSGTAGSATYGRYLYTWTGHVYAQYNHFRGLGFALRCVGPTR